jgi:branched-chain amino acid aminotransferase
MTTPPLYDRDGFIWMDGKMVPWREASVHFLSHSLHYATGVFEGERVYNKKIFKSREHSERLKKSAEFIHLPLDISIETLEDIKQEVIEANKLTNAYMRVLAWRGAEQMGVDPRGALPKIGVAAWDWGKYFDPKLAETGISLGTSKWRKPAPDTAPIHSKACSLYNMHSIAKVESINAGFTDALMHDFEGFVAESTGANLFAVKDGAIITPIADRFLNGITRQTVIAIARDMGITVTEKRMKPEELLSVQEVFLTGTAAEITAVGKIDNTTYGVGPITRKLRAAYSEFAAGSPIATAKTA